LPKLIFYSNSNFTMSRRCVEYFSPDTKQAGTVSISNKLSYVAICGEIPDP